MSLVHRQERTQGLSPVRLEFAFRIDGTDDPDAIRDGGTGAVTAVARDSAGVFIVSFADEDVVLLPRQLTTARVDVHQPTAVLTAEKAMAGFVVDLAIDTAARTVTVCTVSANVAGPATNPAAADPDDNSWVSVVLRGPMFEEHVES